MICKRKHQKSEKQVVKKNYQEMQYLFYRNFLSYLSLRKGRATQLEKKGNINEIKNQKIIVLPRREITGKQKIIKSKVKYNLLCKKTIMEILLLHRIKSIQFLISNNL
ncbi:unnamed protein product [Paramecium sonneborni]|uniref:Uncharacterized protein n=1 Tax=Paramecium sonneborni TaxID=65129 RepID=A0A8S1LVG2_9CILI|nr:unnamed protein product [Paramecium sonneborni]